MAYLIKQPLVLGWGASRHWGWRVPHRLDRLAEGVIGGSRSTCVPLVVEQEKQQGSSRLLVPPSAFVALEHRC